MQTVFIPAHQIDAVNTAADRHSISVHWLFRDAHGGDLTADASDITIILLSI